MVKALLYRWKGVEEAAAQYTRGRKMFDLMKIVFRQLFSEAVVRKAQAELEREARLLQENPDHEEPASMARHRKSVRRGAVVKFMETDVAGDGVAMVLAVCNPLQVFLNATFEADKLLQSPSLFHCMHLIFPPQPLSG